MQYYKDYNKYDTKIIIKYYANFVGNSFGKACPKFQNLSLQETRCH